MLDSTRSRWLGIDSWAGQPLSAFVTFVEEGMALCAVMENGKQSAYVPPTAGANDVFIGFAFNYITSPLALVAVETYTIPAGGGAITVANAPTNAANGAGLRVLDTKTNTAISYNATPGTGVYQIGGTNNQTLTFNAAQAGDPITVMYKYSPTVAQSQLLVGDGQIGSVRPSDVTGTIGLIRRGLIYTSNFDPTVDYSAVNTVLKVGNGGDVTVGGNGPTINGLVYEIPSTDFPYLGINFAAV